jgi:hypothetical protein
MYVCVFLMVLSHEINLVYGDPWVNEGPETFAGPQDADTWEKPNTVKIVREALKNKNAKLQTLSEQWP